MYNNMNEDSIYYENEENEIHEHSRVSKKKKKKKTRWNIIITILLLVSIIAGNRAAAMKWKVHSVFGGLKFDGSSVISNVDEEALAAGTDIVQSDDIINILLVGADKRESWKEAGRSDSCMIATIDMKHKKLKLTSLMRDMYVDIPGYGKHKFNAAYSYGGVELLYKTIVSNFGIKVKGYALVDFAAFKKVVNKLGGINITLTENEYNVLMKRYHRTSVLDLKPGKNKMNGTQALAYCRLRQDINADFGRTERQRYVITQIFNKMKKKPVSKWFEVAEAVMPEITTDLNEEKITEYLKDVIFMGTTKIEQLRIPVDGSYSNGKSNGQDVLEIDLDKNKSEMKKFIFEEKTKSLDKK